eukprot:scaffold115681_cov22-Tisochrysis_lutea.AAC.3
MDPYVEGNILYLGPIKMERCFHFDWTEVENIASSIYRSINMCVALSISMYVTHDQDVPPHCRTKHPQRFYFMTIERFGSNTRHSSTVGSSVLSALSSCSVLLHCVCWAGLLCSTGRHWMVGGDCFVGHGPWGTSRQYAEAALLVFCVPHNWDE